MDEPRIRSYLPPVIRALRRPLVGIAHLLTPLLRLAEKTGLAALVVKAIGPRLNLQELHKNAFAGYEPDESDVIVYAYSKSGTNWTLQIAHQVAHCGQGEFDHIHDVVPWPDDVTRKIALPLEDPGPRQASPTGLRVIKTHLERAYVPVNGRARYIVVFRDPKDVFVSGYFFVKSVILGPLMPSVTAWLDMMLSKGAYFGDWARCTAGYWAERDRENVLVLWYEEMRADLPQAVRQVADFMGVDLSAEAFAAVCERSSFSHMRSVDYKFYPGLISPLGSPRGKMIRTGRSGASGELLSREQQDRIDAYHRSELEMLGSDFPYEARYGAGKDHARSRSARGDIAGLQRQRAPVSGRE